MNTVTNVKCGFLINCTYTGETVTTTTNNAEGVATVTANKAELERSARPLPNGTPSTLA